MPQGGADADCVAPTWSVFKSGLLSRTKALPFTATSSPRKLPLAVTVTVAPGRAPYTPRQFAHPYTGVEKDQWISVSGFFCTKIGVG